MLLKEIQKWREGEEEYLRSYWINWRKKGGSVNWKRKH